MCQVVLQHAAKPSVTYGVLEAMRSFLKAEHTKNADIPDTLEALDREWKVRLSIPPRSDPLEFKFMQDGDIREEAAVVRLIARSRALRFSSDLTSFGGSPEGHLTTMRYCGRMVFVCFSEAGRVVSFVLCHEVGRFD